MTNKKINRKLIIKYSSLIFSLSITILILANWIKPGSIIAYAEEGLGFYNPLRTYETVGNIWIEKSLGFASPWYASRTPTYYFFQLLQGVGLQSWLIQTLLYGVLLFIPLYFMVKLSLLFTGERRSSIGYIASLIYVFNFFTTTQVFHRNVYALMFVWSFLPLFLYLWVLWLREGKTKILLCFIFANFIFSVSFSLPSSILVLWIPAAIYSLGRLVRNKNSRKDVATRTLLAVFLWLLTSMWWIFPMLRIGSNSHSDYLATPDSITTLEQVSKYYENKDIVLLKQKYYFDKDGYFKTYADSKLATLASFTLLLFFLYGAVLSIRGKKYLFFVALLFVGWFVGKGMNPPLGKLFYETLFEYLPYTQFLRNPYEKFGAVFLLGYSVLSAIGIYYAVHLFVDKKMVRWTTLIVAGFLVMFIGRPLYNGDLFWVHYYVQVPEYYDDANSTINSDTDGNILHLPYHKHPSIKYQWGYEGEEPSRDLFDSPSISGTLSKGDVDDFLYVLPNYQKDLNFPNLLKVLNVGSIVVHRDIVKDDYHDLWIDSTVKIVEAWEEVESLGGFGDLSIYKFNKPKSIGTLYASSGLRKVSTLEDGLNHMLTSSFDPEIETVATEEQSAGSVDEFESRGRPEISVEKINNRKYRVGVSGASEKFVLVLAKSFDKFWSAGAGEQEFLEHHEVNGYANGWVVDKKGNYEIDIVYKVWPWE